MIFVFFFRTINNNYADCDLICFTLISQIMYIKCIKYNINMYIYMCVYFFSPSCVNNLRSFTLPMMMCVVCGAYKRHRMHYSKWEYEMQ